MGGVTVAASPCATGDASRGGGGGTGGSATLEADAIFLNFLCRYFPSDSSQRRSTGSMAGTFLEKRDNELLCFHFHSDIGFR